MLKKINLSGTPREIGYQHGMCLKEEIHQLYTTYIKAIQDVPMPASERSILGAAGAHLDMTEQFAPELIEEIEGIAKGAGLDFNKVFFLNCYDEMNLYSHTRQIANACTIFLATDRATSDGKTYLGQGWDMESFFIPYIYQISPKSSSNPKVLMISHPGIVGGAGINEHGISLIWSSLRPKDDKPGVPAPLMIRKVLSCKSLGDAVAVLLNTPRASGFNFIVADYYGGFDIEATATKECITYIPNIFAHANHYESERLLDYEGTLPQVSSSTIIRSGRMNQLLQRFSGKIDIDVCKGILCDHANYPLSICRHSVPEDSIPTETVTSLIFVPEEKYMLASDGQPCKSGFDIFRFEE